MIYPKKIKADKSSKIIKYILLGIIIFGIILSIINKLTVPNIPFAAITNASIIYIVITVLYALNRNINIAGHVLIQLTIIEILMIFFDYKIGYSNWSLQIAYPILIIVANIIMLVLTIISYKKFIRYAIYELIIVIISLIPVILIAKNMLVNNVLSIVASSISIVSFIICFIFTAKDIIEDIKRKFHV